MFGQGKQKGLCYKKSFGELEKVFTKMEIYPHYDGYEEELNKFLINEINIQTLCNNLRDSTRLLEDSVKVKFIVSKTGKMSDITVISINSNLAQEISNVFIKSSCNWVPGYSNRNLNGWYYGVVYFKLDRRKRSFSITISSISK